jgi:hypothetical protein
MKKILGIIIAIIGCYTLVAQTPQAFKYQAIVRDNSGQLIQQQRVHFQISILEGTTSGKSLYIETHIDTTNSYGLVVLEIGHGFTSDDFSSIDWSANSYFVQIEIDETGGTNFKNMGISQLLSVPYALYAETVSNVDDADSDTTNELQILSIIGDTLFIENGNYFILSQLPSNTTIVTDEYAMDNSERTPTTWYSALEICADAGGHLCSSSEFYLACKQVSDGDIEGITNLNNNWEWVWDGGPAGTWAANRWGNGSCDAVSNGLATDNNAYRCCYNR